MSYNGSMYVYSGGTANLTVMSYNGSMYVYSGGEANSTTVNNYSYLHVSNGGAANYTTLSGIFPNLKVSSGGTANSTTVNNGSMYVYNGGTANCTTVSGGILAISSGGVANSTTVVSRGSMFIYAGGTANYTSINASLTYLRIYVSSGGEANHTTVTGRGQLYAASYGVVSDTVLDSGGQLTVMLRGAANGTVVNSGRMYLLGGGSASSIAVYAGGSMEIRNNGKADAISVNSDAIVVVSYGGSACDVSMNGGGFIRIASGGRVSGLDWTPCVGDADIDDDAVVTFVNDPEGVYFGSSGTLLSSAAVMSGKNLSGHVMYVMKNGTVRNTVADCGGRIVVYSGGVVSRGVVQGYGSMTVRHSGMANGVTVSSGGSLFVSSGGTALNVDWTPCVGKILTAIGAVVTFTGDHRGVYFGSENILLSSAMTMTGKTLAGHSMYVMDGGAANETTVNSGYIYVSNGGTANSTVVNSGGTVYIYSGGTASDAAVNSRGLVYVCSGAAANGITVGSGGSIYVSDGATALIRENGGCADIADGASAIFIANSFSGLVLSSYTSSATLHSGTTANSTTVNSGYLYVYSGGVANSTVVSGGNIYVSGGDVYDIAVGGYGYLYVSDGGKVNSAALNSGYIYIFSGGEAEAAVLNSGNLYVSSGGVANSATVNSGSWMYVSSGGKITGGVSFGSGATISAYAGSIVDFDISVAAPGAVARINDLSLIKGDPNYTVTVAASQTPGEYRLAEGAAGFDKTVTVGTEAGTVIGTLSIGDTITVSNVDYSLKLADGALSLGVAFMVEPSNVAESLASGTATCVYDADLAATWTSDTEINSGTLNVVSSDFGGNAWLDIKGTDLAGTTLYGAANTFSGSVNLLATSGAVLGNLAAGATSGGLVGSVKLDIDDAVLGQSYAGGLGTVDGAVETRIASGSMTKDFYAGALANKLDSATSVGNVAMTVEGGTFGGNIYGASAVKTVAGIDGTRHTAGDVTLTVTDGETTKGGEACIFAGGYATGTADGLVYTVDSVTTTISGGSWGSARGGRGVFGGIMASQVTAQVIGDVNLTVSGGSMGNVYGGGWAQKNGTSIVGNVNLTISGGTMANVFGGGSHSTSGGTTVAGDVTITVSGGSITNAIYARGQLVDDSVTDAEVIFEGATDFTCDVFGYVRVGGGDSDAALSFSGYTGEFSGKIGGFGGVTFSGATAMTLAAAADAVDNTEWKFDVTERAAELAGTALLDWTAADFTGDIITLKLASGSTNGWNLVDAAADTNYHKFDVWVDGASIVTAPIGLGDQIADGDYAGWGFALEGTVLKFKNLATA